MFGSRRVCRCVIADRSDVFADGLQATLEAIDAGYVVVGRVREPDEVEDCVTRTRADIVLTGFEPVSDSDGVALRLHPIPVLVFSWSRRKEDVIATIRAGAAAFVLKSNLGREELLRALHDVEIGRSSFELGTVSVVRPEHEQRRPSATRVNDIVLTPRELEIVSLIVDGESNKEIALHLGIAQQTVKNHLRNIMTKSNVSSRLQLCGWALAVGIVANGDGARPANHQRAVVL